MNKQVFTSFIYTILQRLSGLVFGFGSFYLLVRMFEPNVFGTWSIFVTVTALIEVARNGFIQNAMIKALNNPELTDKKAIFRAAFGLNFVITVVSLVFLVSGGYLLGLLWDNYLLTRLMFAYTFTTIIIIPFSQFNYIQQSKMDFKGIFYTYLVRQGGFFVFLFYVYINHFILSPLVLVYALTLCSALGAVVGYFFTKSYLPLEWLKPEFNKGTGQLFHFGKYVFGTNISSMLFNSIDQFSLNTLLNESAVAVYNCSLRVSNMIDVPVSSLSAILFPYLSKNSYNGNSNTVYEKSTGYLMALIIPVLLAGWVFAEPIIYFTAGEKYLEAVPILKITLIFSLFMPFMRQFGTFLDSHGQPKTNFKYILALLMINTLINFSLIPLFNISGAAWATLISMVFGFLFANFYLSKHYGIKFFRILYHSIAFYPFVIKTILNKLK